MKKIAVITFLSFTIFLTSCGGVNCGKLPKTYSSYREAIKTIQAAHFNIQETINTSKKSWIQDASYYSCDGKVGFFIFKTHGREYIYSDVPITAWEGFKKARSFGSYYDHRIKHRYHFILNH